MSQKKTRGRKKTAIKSPAATKTQQSALPLQAAPLKRKDKFQCPRGMHDLLSEDWVYYDFIYRTMESVMHSYDFGRIETPMMENAGVFTRAIGEETDIVSKEMFLIQGRGKDKMAMRPEFTAGVIRAYIENGMSSRPQPVKLFSYGPLFRAERPQAGRYREFNQLNFEILGGEKPALDAQVIQLAWRILERIGLRDIVVQINSMGCPECRPVYRQLLLDYYKPHANKLCVDCKKRLRKNPSRLLDCKEEKCQRIAANAPQTFDNLCDDCHEHFKFILEMMDELDIPYELNSRIVRGLDYYQRTVFEIWPTDGAKGELAQSALGGGGRYDGLVELMGGHPTPGLGVAIGVERVILEMKERSIMPPKMPVPTIFLAQLSEKAKKESFRIFEDLYRAGLDAIESVGRDSLKSQLKQAEKREVTYTLIFGQKESVDNTIIIRDMETGVQEVIAQEKMIDYLKNGLQKKEEEKREDKGKKSKKDPESPEKEEVKK